MPNMPLCEHKLDPSVCVICDRETQAQIARVIFDSIAEDKPVTDAQRSQLVDWIRGHNIRTWDAGNPNES